MNEGRYEIESKDEREESLNGKWEREKTDRKRKDVYNLRYKWEKKL